MARIRSVAASSPAMLVAIVALVFALGGGAGYATAVQSSSRLTFNPLHLINGWVPDGYDTGTPSYAISGGVVYLSGGVRLPSGTSNNFTVLPTSARPAHVLWMPAYGQQGTNVASLEITPNGRIYATSQGNASLVSLAGVSFPVGS